jgi:hypothetical protein
MCRSGADTASHRVPAVGGKELIPSAGFCTDLIALLLLRIP